MMSFPKTRPGNPDRGWNDPPMFNFTPGAQSATPKRMLNKRVAFPASAPSQPGHAVLSPAAGPPVLNPVLSGSVLSQPEVKPPQIPIGLRDTPLGNQAPPISPVQLLPPTSDASAPQAVPLLVPGLVPAAPPVTKEPAPQTGIQDERLEELLTRLGISEDGKLLEHNLNYLNAEFNKYRPILTIKVCEDIKKKFDLIEDKWKKGGLSDVVKVRLTQLAEALSREETDKANQLHLALMVDHISEVNQWMMAVKRLVQQQQLASKERELLSDKSASSEQNQENSEKSDKTEPESDNSQNVDNCDRELDEGVTNDGLANGNNVSSTDSNETDRGEVDEQETITTQTDTAVES